MIRENALRSSGAARCASGGDSTHWARRAAPAQPVAGVQNQLVFEVAALRLGHGGRPEDGPGPGNQFASNDAVEFAGFVQDKEAASVHAAVADEFKGADHAEIAVVLAQVAQQEMKGGFDLLGPSVVETHGCGLIGRGREGEAAAEPHAPGSAAASPYHPGQWFPQQVCPLTGHPCQTPTLSQTQGGYSW